MKTYEKPNLMVLSLSGNERLCGDCAGGNTLATDPRLAQFLATFFGVPDVNGNGPDREDFKNVFGDGEKGCSIALKGYCKFAATGTGGKLIIWS